MTRYSPGAGTRQLDRDEPSYYNIDELKQPLSDLLSGAVCYKKSWVKTMRTILSTDEKQTQRLGYCLGACLRAGDVVLLYGEMGAGKSVLTRAAARGMGVCGPVPSPTFTILNIHEGKTLRLYHFDLYRLEGADALYEMGLDEFIPAPDGASLIEWPQMAAEAMPQDALVIELRYAQDGMARQIELRPMGAFDEERLNEIMKMLEDGHEYPDD